MTSIKCEKTGVEITIDRTDGGNGRINAVRVYDAQGKLRVVTAIYLGGSQVETRKVE